MQKPPKYKGFTHLMKAIAYSYNGFKAAIKETAFRHELLLSVIAIPLAFYLAQNKLELIWLISSLLAILIVELINTAIEACIDRISEEFHWLSAKAKDLGSTAVMFTLLNAVVVWLIVIFY